MYPDLQFLDRGHVSYPWGYPEKGPSFQHMM